MPIVAESMPAVPTNLAPLPRLLAYAQGLGLERWLARPSRGVSTLALAQLWLVLAWRGSGRPAHADHLDEPLLAALLGRSCCRAPALCVAAWPASQPLASAPLWKRTTWPNCPAALAGSGRPWMLTRCPTGGAASKPASPRAGRAAMAAACAATGSTYEVDIDTGQIITYLLAHGRTHDGQVLALLARRLRRLLGRRLAGVVADCGFTSRASVTALLGTKVSFILGFSRSAPVRAWLHTLSGHERRWLRDGGAIDLGACHWGGRLRLIALAARTPTDRRGPWVYVTSR